MLFISYRYAWWIYKQTIPLKNDSCDICKFVGDILYYSYIWYIVYTVVQIDATHVSAFDDTSHSKDVHRKPLLMYFVLIFWKCASLMNL